MTTKVPSNMAIHPFNTVRGADVASASAINLDAATGEVVRITGTTPITSVTLADGATRICMAQAALPLVHSANLVLQTGANITLAAGDIILFIGLAAGVVRAYFFKASGAPVAGASGFNNALLHVREQQPSGTHGGTFTSGARRTRVLNTILTNEIGASLAGDTVTIQSGTYYAEFSCPANDVRSHKAWLRNVTASTDLIIGSSACARGDSEPITNSEGKGRFTINVTSQVRLEHQCQETGSTLGFGKATGFGPEVYSELLIWKIA
jgi:hypothetical protein